IGLIVNTPPETGLCVHGIPILGGYDRLETIVAERAPDAVLVAASALATPGVREALGRVRAAGRPVHLIPELDEVLDGRPAERAPRPEVVFHAAAYKHVPLMERNAGEAFKTNVLGTKIMAEACGRAGVGVFVLVSTDKAVEPVSVMGASKRLAELAVQGLAP